ncbi:hypothetical protein BHE74_00020976 [Ensete ventricosum]|nr:hypothetical protein BHE74_00020976 [Ensete ventricosum]
MSMLDAFFNKGFKGAKCKTLLKLTIPRIKLLRNRREIQLKQMRKDIAKLLENGQEATARIRGGKTDLPQWQEARRAPHREDHGSCDEVRRHDTEADRIYWAGTRVFPLSTGQAQEFFRSLIEQPPATLPEMLQRAHQYMAAETLVAGKRDETKRPRVEQPRGHPPSPPKRREDRNLLSNLGEGPLKAPNQMKSHSLRHGKRRYCRFHREYDHDTEECRDLQYQIEDLIRRGHLHQYVRDQSSLPDSRPPRDSSPRPKGPVEKQIDVGKRSAHDEDLDITFKSGGEEYPCHDDALVISIRMANAYVKRVMIDTGSLTDILYFEAFQKLGLTDKDLVTLTSTFTGFTGDFVSPLGATTIPVMFGGEPRSKTLMVSFMVVKLPSAYNAIIGRPILNRLKAVVSTYHRLLKFPTRAGVGEVRSDPRESIQCYLTTITLYKKPKVQSAAAGPQNPEDSARDPHPVEQTVLPPEVVFPILRVQTHDEEASNQQLHENLDLLEEKRADAHLRTLAYRRVIAKLYNRRVCPRLVKMGDLVLRKAEVSDPTRSRGKLAPNWEVLTESSKLSEMGLTHWQQWRGECYRTFQIYKNFTHNMERCAPSCIEENAITKDVGN